MKRILIAFLFAAPLCAADNVVVLRAARLIDGKGGAVMQPAVVVVRGNKIEAIGGSIPAGASTIDLGDMTLLPGLIDAYTHILLQGDITASDYDEQLFRESLPYRALRASRAAKIALDHGFTALRDLETEGAMYTDVDVKRAINNGVIPGPRLFVSTRAMSVTGGYGPSGYSPEVTHPMGVQIVDGVEAGRKAVREQIAHGADWIKVYADRSYFVMPDGKLSSIPTFTPEETPPARRSQWGTPPSTQAVEGPWATERAQQTFEEMVRVRRRKMRSHTILSWTAESLWAKAETPRWPCGGYNRVLLGG